MDVELNNQVIKNKNKDSNEKGQAFLEFIIFLPFVVTLYSLMMTFSNAINASINQQKITRAYFYYRLQNNSLVPGPYRGDVEPAMSWTNFGQQITLWAEKDVDFSPVMPCFKMDLPVSSGEEQECESHYTGSKTDLIRVGTVYGICGATYNQNQGILKLYPSNGLDPLGTIMSFSCLIQ